MTDTKHNRVPMLCERCKIEGKHCLDRKDPCHVKKSTKPGKPQ